MCVHFIKGSGSASQSVLLSFRLLALKSWTSHRLDEESETISATSRVTWMLRHATEKQRPKDHRYVSRQWRLQRPLPLSVFASLFQYVSVTENEDLQPKHAKTIYGRQSTDWWWKWRRRQRSCHRCRWQYPCPKLASCNICSHSTCAVAFFRHLNQPSKVTFERSFCWWLCHTRFTRMHDTTEEHCHERTSGQDTTLF